MMMATNVKEFLKTIICCLEEVGYIRGDLLVGKRNLGSKGAAIETLFLCIWIGFFIIKAHFQDYSEMQKYWGGFEQQLTIHNYPCVGLLCLTENQPCDCVYFLFSCIHLNLVEESCRQRSKYLCKRPTQSSDTLPVFSREADFLLKYIVTMSMIQYVKVI